MLNRNQKQFIILIVPLVVIVLLGVVINTYQNREGKSKDFRQKTPFQELENTVATGILIDEYSEGRRLFTLGIDAVSTYKKKIGVFRLGFWKVVRLENVCINFYETPDEKLLMSGEKNGPTISRDPYSINRVAAKYFQDLGKNSLSNNKLRLLNLKGVKGIEIDKLRINFFQDNRTISSIFGDNAKINFDKRNLILEGHVRIESGEDRSLECSKICWSLEAKRLRTIGPYVAKLRNCILEGKDFETDYLLNNLKEMERVNESF